MHGTAVVQTGHAGGATVAGGGTAAGEPTEPNVTDVPDGPCDCVSPGIILASKMAGSTIKSR